MADEAENIELAVRAKMKLHLVCWAFGNDPLVKFKFLLCFIGQPWI